MFPDKIKNDRHDGQTYWEGARNNLRNFKVHQSGNRENYKSLNKGKKSSVKSDRQIAMPPQAKEQHVPKAPKVRHDGHRKNNNAFDSNRNVKRIAGNCESGHD